MFIGEHLGHGINKIVIKISKVTLINRILENRIHFLDRIIVKPIFDLFKIGSDIKRKIIISWWKCDKSELIGELLKQMMKTRVESRTRELLYGKEVHREEDQNPQESKTHEIWLSSLHSYLKQHE
uniref:Uncharacterized protein n=1 Tax=Tanacetum cinerariifolium TaxID=118510 RepID=A0A699SQ20_TANCI|nr:hypothetical protein [Tanacetum cinerariifolium]